MTQAALGLENVPARLYPCTPSRLATWLDCPQRYRMAYLVRPTPPKGPPWAHNSLGAAVHNALASWWKLERRSRTPDAAGDLVESGWIRDGFRDDEQSSTWRARARRMTVDYVAGLDPSAEPRGVERIVSTRTQSLALTGRIDRLDERPTPDGSELVVVDYKTGRREPTGDETRGSIALAIYAAAAERTLRRPCRKVELHHLPSGSVIAHEHTDSSLDRQLARAAVIASEAAAADARHREGLDAAEVDAVFPAKPSTACSWCDFRRHCPEGREGSVELNSWDGLASD